MKMKKYLAILLGLMLLLVPAGYAQEDASENVSCMTGMVTGMAPDALSIRWEDGCVYTFQVASRVDTSLLTGALGLGRTVTIYYNGIVSWETADASAAQVIAVEDGYLEYPYGTMVYDPTRSIQNLHLDLDQDGIIETLSIKASESSRAVLQVNDASWDCVSPYFLMVCDLDPEDSHLDIFLTEQTAPMSFSTIHLQYTDRQLQQYGRLNGMASDFWEGYVVVCDKISLLGADFFAETYYCLDESGKLSQDMDAIWNFCRQEEASPLSLQRDLPATILTDAGEMETTLSAGSELYLTASDGRNTVWFEMTDGQCGWFFGDAAQDGCFLFDQSPVNRPPYFQ